MIPGAGRNNLKPAVKMTAVAQPDLVRSVYFASDVWFHYAYKVRAILDTPGVSRIRLRMTRSHRFVRDVGTEPVEEESGAAWLMSGLIRIRV